jgi:hypothetical protein
MSTQKNKSFPITYSKELLEANFEGEPVRILFKLMDSHVWFGDNLIKKYNQDRFADSCGISRWTLIRHLKYLVKFKLILKLNPNDKDQYINPRYCSRCTEGKRQELIETLCLGKGVFVYGVPIEPPDPYPFQAVPRRQNKKTSLMRWFWNMANVAPAQEYEMEEMSIRYRYFLNPELYE